MGGLTDPNTFMVVNDDNDTNGHANTAGGTTNGVSTVNTNLKDHTTNGHTTNGDISINGHASTDVSASSADTSFAESMVKTVSTTMSSVPKAEPIAIVGMAMRLPGGIRDSEALWDLLVNKRDAQCKVPADRYNIEAFHGPSNRPASVATQYGYFLQDIDLANLDASFWSMTRQEAEAMDPQQRLLLEVVYECLENAGLKGWRGQNIGCYVGTFGEDWLDLDLKDEEQSNMYRMVGYSDYILSNRVSYEFGFMGPSMTVRTACSSSLTGLHEACMALGRGECDGAVVGGASIITSPRMTVALTDQGVLSPTGSCKTFDANADGYARGEGVTAIYVKRLNDAVRDGDTIRAVIRSTAVNSDGKTPGMTMPNTHGHEAVIRRAYESAGISDFSQTAMIECHGTGTKVGDPIETKAVGRIFGEDGVYIGSVKPNLGHSEGNSGLSSVLKMVMALEKNTIPPQINFDTPNPNIPFEEAKLTVPIDPTPWPEQKAQRVGVNSFGIGGANAHVILESAECYGINQQLRSRSTHGNGDIDVLSSDNQDAYLLIFSAKHSNALRDNVKAHELYALANPMVLGDMSYSLSSHREFHSHRAFCIATPYLPLEISPTISTPNTSVNLVFTFTGQGAQWAQMGKRLFETNPVYRQAIRHLDSVLVALAEPPSWSLENEILASKNRSRLAEAEFSQPCCTAIQIGLVEVLKMLNVRPSAVIGHSSGEIAAAYAAEAISAEEAILIAYHRGQSTRGVGKIHWGGMAAIGLGRNEITPYLRPGVIIGCENSPASVTITGDMEVLEEVMQSVRDDYPDALVRSLRVECAYHSYHMRTVAEKYLSLMAGIVHSKAPKVPFYSSVSGKILRHDGALSPQYWVENLVSPVLFYSAVNLVLDTLPSPKVFLEIGPHSALAGPVRQIIRAHSNGQGAEHVATLIRNNNAAIDILNTAGQLWLRNIDVDFSSIISKGKLLTDLPAYHWQYEGKYWSESRLSKEWRLRKFPRHDILGTRIIQSTDAAPSWRNILRLDNVPWIRDHEIGGDILFPGAAFIAMAGEAIRQLSADTSEAYTVRRVNISSALVLQSSETVEILTNLRRVKLTNTLDSDWYDFTISSLHGETWTTHISGMVRAGSEHVRGSPQAIKSLPRHVSSATWYKAMSRVGMGYGPRFRPLTEISTHVTEQKAVATMHKPQVYSTESEYQLHPTELDATFQLFTAAAVRGVDRKLNVLCVPTYIDELYVCKPKGDIKVAVDASSTPRGLLSGSLTGVSSGETVIDLKGFRMSPLGGIVDYSNAGDTTGGAVDSHAAVELQWDRDINFVDTPTLIRPARDINEDNTLLEKFTLACMIETRYRLENIKERAAKPHFEKLSAWLKVQWEAALTGSYTTVSVCESMALMTTEERVKLIETLYGTLSTTAATSVATGVYQILLNIEKLWSGVAEPLDILTKDNILAGIHDLMQLFDWSEYFRLLVHSNPTLRILEIGAGTGATTSNILPLLSSEVYGERMYASYTYTDSSEGLLAGAKERFKDVPALEYSVLDISKDPMEQGFEPESYDFIIASNVIHATPSLGESLECVKKLLHPRGRLFLQELSPTTKWVNFVFGIFPGWWLGEADRRVDEPYVGHERWTTELEAAGFGAVESRSFDGCLNNLMIVKSGPGNSNDSFSPRVTIISRQTSAASNAVVEQLVKRGYELDICSLQDKPPANQVIISLLDLEAPFLHNATAEQFLAFQELLNHVSAAGILWVTGAAHINCRDPRYSMILGMARTLRSELRIDFATLELETLDAQTASTWAPIVVDVLHEFSHRTSSDDMAPILEYAYAEGSVHTSKFHWVSVPDALLNEKDSVLPKLLKVGRPGALQTLQWVQSEDSLPELTGDSVEIAVRAVGLNFKDVLIAMGIVENTASSLGLECTGVVTKIGPQVQHLKVGDRVMSMPHGAFAMSLSTSESLCVRLPDGLSFAEGATIPCVYGTVIYSLLDLAHLEKGQSVLIHSACGGVGMAAIQIAKMIGAEIYCTVGNEDKVQILINRFGIPRDHIFHSRDSTFLPNIQAATSGRGVDVVLNSLSGELLHASWKCVAEFGTMIEIGKRDFIGQASLSMDLFEQNRSFMGVDLSQVCIHRPQLMNRILRRAVEFLESGSVKPIAPIKEFDACHVEDAFRYMQKGQHIGKVVVTFPEALGEAADDGLSVVTQQKQLRLRTDRAYLLVGGLGGLGRSVASWLVENGARHIIFLSRSAGQIPKDDPYFQELEAQGCFVQAVSGSVVDTSDVLKVVRFAGKPIGGVFQASMVLRDVAINDMTFEQWKEATTPKVQGTWNLHKVLLRQKEPLDFFFLFSSVSGVAGQHGQANYAAANTFLDAFVQYRHSLGLPASVLDIGVMEDVGFLTQNTKVLDQFRATAIHLVHEQEFLNSLQLMLHRSQASTCHASHAARGFVNRSQVGIGMRSSLPLAAKNNRTLWKRDPRMAIYRNLESLDPLASSNGAGSTSDTASRLKSFIASAKANPASLDEEESVAFLAKEIGETLFGFMTRNTEDMDLMAPLSSMGVDSLVSIELRHWLRLNLGAELTVLEIVGSGTLLGLGVKTAGKLKEKFS